MATRRHPGLFGRVRDSYRRVRLDPGMPYADCAFKPFNGK